MKISRDQRSRSVGAGRNLVFLLVGAVMVLVATQGRAGDPHGGTGDPPTRKEKLKAAIVSKITDFVEWPEGAFGPDDETLNICVLSKRPLPIQYSGRSRHGRVSVLADDAFDGEFDLGPCHVLFIGKSEEGRLGQILDRLGDSSVLTVSDIDGFIEKGGMIGLVEVENKFRFDVNMDAATKGNLKISSKLAKLARFVKMGGVTRGRRD